MLLAVIFALSFVPARWSDSAEAQEERPCPGGFQCFTGPPKHHTCCKNTEVCRGAAGCVPCTSGSMRCDEFTCCSAGLLCAYFGSEGTQCLTPQACGGMRGYDCLGGICCVARVCYPMGVGGGGAGRNLWKGMQWPKELCKKLFKGPEGQIGGGGGGPDAPGPMR